MVETANHWADHFGIEKELVHAVIEAESAWKPTAVSHAGAAGLMQLMPATAATFEVRNRFDVTENIRGGVCLPGRASLPRIRSPSSRT
jgi:soluble lytic murein transglycosylase-like protein